MAEKRSRASRKSNRTPGEDRPAKDDFIEGPPPEATNYTHPDAPGARTSVPGEGVVSGGVTGAGAKTDAGPRDPSHPIRQHAPADPQAPGQVEPTGSAGAAAREVNDPNYTAATRTPDDRTAASPMNPDLEATTEPRRTVHPIQARDVMTTNVEVAAPDTDIYYVARMMAERDVGAIPIVESTDSMRPLGIITDRDIVVRMLAKNQGPDEVDAGDVMTPVVITVRTDTPLEEVVGRMREHRLQRIVVVDDANRLVGIIAHGDITSPV